MKIIRNYKMANSLLTILTVSSASFAHLDSNQVIILKIQYRIKEIDLIWLDGFISRRF